LRRGIEHRNTLGVGGGLNVRHAVEAGGHSLAREETARVGYEQGLGSTGFLKRPAAPGEGGEGAVGLKRHGRAQERAPRRCAARVTFPTKGAGMFLWALSQSASPPSATSPPEVLGKGRGWVNLSAGREWGSLGVFSGRKGFRARGIPQVKFVYSCTPAGMGLFRGSVGRAPSRGFMNRLNSSGLGDAGSPQGACR